MSVQVVAPLGRLSLRPSLKLDHIVSDESAGISIIKKARKGLFTFEEARQGFEELRRTDPTFHRHVDLDGRSYLEVLLEEPFGGFSQFSLLEFMINDLGISRGTDTPRHNAGLCAMTPLHEAVAFRILKAGGQLIPKFKNHKNFLGQTALHFAVLDPVSIDCLISSGCDIDSTDNYGHTPLMYAAALGQKESLMKLIDAGADLGARDHRFGRLFFHFAMIRSNWFLVLDILDKMELLFGKHETEAWKQYTTVEFLRRRVFSPPDEGLSLHKFLSRCASPDFLLDEDPDGVKGNCLLHCVKSVEHIRALLDHGTKLINHPNSNGQRPIMLATRTSVRANLIRCFVGAGADVNLEDKWHRSVLAYELQNLDREEIAEIADTIETIGILLDNGANVHPPAIDHDVFKTVSNYRIPIWSFEWCTMLWERRGIDEAKQAILSFIRRWKHGELGMTHVCCTRQYEGLRPTFVLDPPSNLPQDDIEEILEEESTFNQILDEEMQQISRNSYASLLEIRLLQIKQSCDKIMMEAARYNSNFLADPRNRVYLKNIGYELFVKFNFKNPLRDITSDITTYIYWIETEYHIGLARQVSRDSPRLRVNNLIMKYTKVLLFAVVAAAQTTDFPPCAQKCADDAVTSHTSCSGPDDYSCICVPDNIQKIDNNSRNCILYQCQDSISDIELDGMGDQVVPHLEAICARRGEGSDTDGTRSGSPSLVPVPTATGSPEDPESTGENEGSAGPLTGSAIRLIRISPDEHGPVRCNLFHMPLAVVPPPQYIAISYTWGDEKDKKNIVVDSHDIAIPENLYRALRLLRALEIQDSKKGFGPWLPENTLLFARRPWLFWADALCINQDDAKEKTTEIPKMMNIFGSAQEVIGWLGHRLPRGVTYEVLFDVLEKGKGLKARFRNEWLDLLYGHEKKLREALGEQDLTKIREVIFRIAESPWFTRLWVIQENAACANRPVALILAGHVFDAEDFYSLVNLFAHRPKWFLESTSLSCSVAMFRTRSHYEMHAGRVTPDEIVGIPKSNDEELLFAWRLHTLLLQASTAPFRSTLKHDMIYGILSMAMPPEVMPPQLAIDYGLDWSETCRRYARFIAEQTGAISFLSRIRHPTSSWGEESERARSIPSWVPNFSFPSITIHSEFLSSVERGRFDGSIVTFSKEGHAMTIDGFSLGKPVALTRRQGLIQRQEKLYSRETPNEYNRGDAIEFLEEILKPAAAQRNCPLNEVLKCWITAWERSVDRNIVDSEEAKIRRTYKRWIRGAGSDRLCLDGPKIQGRHFSERGLMVAHGGDSINNSMIEELSADESIGFVRTHSADDIMTNSAAASTAFSTGIKTNNDYVATSPDGQPVGTILEAAKLAGYKTGLVVTSNIYHATPACFSAHTPDRGDSEGISAQQIGYSHSLGPVVDFLLGGGRCKLKPNADPGSCRDDKIDLVGERDMLLEMDRSQTNEEPSLLEMSRSAINALTHTTEDSDKGSFPMIEASRIDHAAHDNDPVGVLHETIMHNDVIKYLKECIDSNHDTVLLAAADHGTGGIANLQGQNPFRMSNATASGDILHIAWMNYNGTDPCGFWTESLLPRFALEDATEEDIEILLNSGIDDWKPNLVGMMSKMVGLLWASFEHTSVDTTLVAYGKGC
ncbi:heterokaryon incompatibility protein-domain-containing protein [Paramyrothecium foliicola]|nr:heterokaryon incompatibility protein-domain-containing protein [Paramyrothecium foliicola]